MSRIQSGPQRTPRNIASPSRRQQHRYPRSGGAYVLGSRSLPGGRARDHDKPFCSAARAVRGTRCPRGTYPNHKARGGRRAGSRDNMRNQVSKRRSDDLRPEYDLSTLRGSVRSKYYKQATTGTNLVLLEPDVAQAFPDSSSVNRALRLLQEVARKSSKCKSSPRATGWRGCESVAHEGSAFLPRSLLVKPGSPIGSR